MGCEAFENRLEAKDGANLLLSVDVGKAGCGCALWREAVLVNAFFSSVNVPESSGESFSWGLMAFGIVTACSERLEKDFPGHAVVETMTHRPYGKSRPADILNLQGIAGAVLGAAAVMGAEAEGVTPVWKGQVPRDVMGARMEMKVREAGWWDVVEVPRRSTQLNDVMHAIGLGAWWWKRRGMDPWRPLPRR